jgi:hypothetical protein
MAERRRDIQPAELAALVDLAEHPRVGDWSLRSALTRYAQPEPQRVSDLLDLVRRIEAVIGATQKSIEADGPNVWAQLQEALASPRQATGLVGLLETMVEIDRLGDLLATWAVDPSVTDRPNEEFDAVVADVRERLAALGVPEQQGGPPPGARRRG